MADGNPLIAERVDSTEWYTGVGIAEGIADLVSGVDSGSWVDASIGGLATGLEALAFVLDPLGSLVSWGVAWLIEHVKPLSDALDWLAGDPDQITAYAGTWTNVAKAVAEAALELADVVRAEVASWTGEAGDAYRSYAAQHVRALSDLASASSAMGSITTGAALLVSLVRELVRDVIAEFVSILAVRLWEWLAIEAGTLGIGTPYVVAQVSSLVAKWAAQIARLVTGLIRSMNNLTPIIRRLDDLIDALKAVLRGLRNRPTFSAAPPTRSGPPVRGPTSAAPGTPSTPDVGTPDGPSVAGSPEPYVPGRLDSLDPTGPRSPSADSPGGAGGSAPLGTPGGPSLPAGGGGGRAGGGSHRLPGGANWVDTPQSPRAGRFYDEVRTGPDDSATIAANTGIRPDVIARVREHLFIREHDVLVDGTTVRGNFAPMDFIADLWERAGSGTLDETEAIQFHRLVAHEYVESRLMEGGMPYTVDDPNRYDAPHPAPGQVPPLGAHDLAPRSSGVRPPFAHWPGFGLDPPDFDLADDLSNLDDVVDLIERMTR